MTNRPRLSERVVFTVDAPRADFWRGEIFDVWDGSAWTRSDRDVSRSAPRATPCARSSTPTTRRDQWRTDDPNVHAGVGLRRVLFAAPEAVEFQTRKMIVGRPDGTAAVVGGLGRDAVYTVTSRSSLPTEETLRAADANTVRDEISDQYAQAPVATERVRQLAVRITAGASTSYDKIPRSNAGSGSHTRIPSTRHSRRAAPTSSTTSCSSRARVGASRSRAASSSSPAAWASRPGWPQASCRVIVIRCPAGSSCANETRTPGPRCSSRESAGRASTRPRRCPWRATRARAARGSRPPAITWWNSSWCSASCVGPSSPRPTCWRASGGGSRAALVGCAHARPARTRSAPRRATARARGNATRVLPGARDIAEPARTRGRR